jgi:hypothetical protein
MLCLKLAVMYCAGYMQQNFLVLHAPGHTSWYSHCFTAAPALAVCTRITVQKTERIHFSLLSVCEVTFPYDTDTVS